MTGPFKVNNIQIKPGHIFHTDLPMASEIIITAYVKGGAGIVFTNFKNKKFKRVKLGCKKCKKKIGIFYTKAYHLNTNVFCETCRQIKKLQE